MVDHYAPRQFSSDAVVTEKTGTGTNELSIKLLQDVMARLLIPTLCLDIYIGSSLFLHLLRISHGPGRRIQCGPLDVLLILLILQAID